jgi:hypothetical protein
MPNRTERREAERVARKLAFEQSRQQRAQSETISEAQLAANRANAQLSRGPVTETGKATSSLNAVKHGLTGQTILLSATEAEAYQLALDEHVAQYQPVTFEERRLTQSAHDCAFRLNRILNIESALYAKGRIELQSSFADMPEHERESFVRLETAERYAKALKNLHIQEARLQRQRAKDISALQQLIQERKAEEAEVVETVESQPRAEASQPAAQENGFVFENSQTPVQPAPEHLINRGIGAAA